MNVAAKLERAKTAPLTWDPASGGRPGWLTFRDDKSYDLGLDPSGARFAEITARMLHGRYYPPDVLMIYGEFQSDQRPLRKGDRILQLAPLFGRLGGPKLAASTEMFVAETEPGRTRIGYVTTRFHLARGIWSAELTRRGERLTLHVLGTAVPSSWLFWLGLPYARWLQKRAWRRAVEIFRAL
jgi:hypothetical protein